MNTLEQDRVIAGNSTSDYNHLDIFRNLKGDNFETIKKSFPLFRYYRNSSFVMYVYFLYSTNY